MYSEQKKPDYRTRALLEEVELRDLAPYACKSLESLGRQYPDEEPDYRMAFQRDRDRIIHTTAFRRLQYKTQVFFYHEGDHYRSRAAHTTETAQIAKTIARALGVNEDLTEAIALAHDIGHPPFGHAGEDTLNKAKKDEAQDIIRRLEQLIEGRSAPLGVEERGKLKDSLGEAKRETPSVKFNHTEHALKIVEELEIRYHDFPGLNLTWETREGIVKHETKYDLVSSEIRGRFGCDLQPSIEAQIVNYADSMAYTTADLDDGLRSRILSWNDKELDNLDLWRLACKEIPEDNEQIRDLIRHRRVRFILDVLVTDLISTSSKMLKKLTPKSVSDVRNCPHPVVLMSREFADAKTQLMNFLYETLYRSPAVTCMYFRAQKTISDLLKALCSDIRLLPLEVQRRMNHVSFYPLDLKSMPGSTPILSIKALDVITDYIAGMTDRYAQEQWGRFFDLGTPRKSLRL